MGGRGSGRSERRRGGGGRGVVAGDEGVDERGADAVRVAGHGGAPFEEHARKLSSPPVGPKKDNYNDNKNDDK